MRARKFIDVLKVDAQGLIIRAWRRSSTSEMCDV